MSIDRGQLGGPLLGSVQCSATPPLPPRREQQHRRYDYLTCYFSASCAEMSRQVWSSYARAWSQLLDSLKLLSQCLHL